MENVVTIKLDEGAVVDQEKYQVSPYARWFNDKSIAWSKEPENNKFFVMRQQDYANELLKHRGYLFLNDVYDMLGIPRSKAGQVVGWIYDPEDPNRDSYVDFGIFNIRNQDFVNEYEGCLLLDFNVDGMILDRF